MSDARFFNTRKLPIPVQSGIASVKSVVAAIPRSLASVSPNRSWPQVAPVTAASTTTSAAIVELARGVGVELPIAETVVEILSGRLSAREAVRRLMTRDLKEERN